jgi:hypothetical protein
MLGQTPSPHDVGRSEDPKKSRLRGVEAAMIRPPFAFYVAENTRFTILDSALASARYAAMTCDDPGDGSLRSRSIDGLPDGTLIPFRGRFFEGVGYCADSVFAANQLIRLGLILGSASLQHTGVRVADHALHGGFFDHPSIPVRLYRDTQTGEFLDNLESRDGYLEVIHIARVAQQLALLSDVYGDAPTKARIREIVVRTADWLVRVERCGNGWLPRRCTPEGAVFPEKAPDAFGAVTLAGEFEPDPIFDRSGGGALIVQCWAEVHARGWRDLARPLTEVVDAFIAGDGYFGSTNCDTEDEHENASYALAYQALHQASTVLERSAWATWAYDRCLRPLEGFELVEDLNGLATKGLLWMEESWNSACSWENAAAAQAYLIAYGDRRERRLLLKALTILRALAKHHHGPFGFLTEAVDWDAHSVNERHIDGLLYADILTTHPFLNNLAILEPTITYLDRFAHRVGQAGATSHWYDVEGNLLGASPFGDSESATSGAVGAVERIGPRSEP